MAEQIVHADIRFAGSVGFNKNYSVFPTNPKPQTMIVKDGVPYMYVDLGSGYFSWFPMATKQSAYIHSQGLPAEEWTINHSLGSVSYGLFAYDENHTLMVANHAPVDANTVKAYFASAVMGSVVIFAVETFSATAVVTSQTTIGTLLLTDDGQGNLDANGNDLAYKQFVLDGLALKANTTDVTAAIQAVVDAAPEALNTLREIALEMQADQSAAGALTALVATKASAADLAAEVLARDAAIAAATPSFADLTSNPTTLAGYGITNAVSTAGAQTIAGSKLFSDVVYLGDSGFMFNSDYLKDTGLSWASDGVFNVKINGSTLGQFNSTGWTGKAGTATKLATAVNINGVAFDGSTAITINAVDATARATVTDLNLKANQATTYTKVESDERIQAVVGAAPLALDTLVEIAAQLASDESAAAALVNTVATKVDKVTGKGLSTEDYTSAEKTKLAGAAPLASPTFTGDTVLSGKLAISSPINSTAKVSISSGITGGTTAYNVLNNATVQSDVTGNASIYASGAFTAASAFTLASYQHYNATQGTFGAGSTVTTQIGFLANSSLIGATNNYSFYGNIPAGTGRYNLFMGGSADNYLAGNLGIGAVPIAGQSLSVSKSISGNVTSMGVRSSGVVQSDVTVQARGFDSTFTTAAASFTLRAFRHYYACQLALGADSTVTDQQGYYVESNVTGATNNHGFQGNIASGIGRYNLYMSGTAANYLAGDLQLGKVITATGTNGAQTINTTTGSVNFAAAATSLVVTNSLVTANSVIIATVASNDTTMKSVQVVAAAGSFTLYASAAATAATRVNFLITN